MGEIKYSFIIPVRTIGEYLKEALEKLVKIKRDDYEIIVYSNEEIKEQWSKTRFIKTENLGPAQKRDLATRDAKGEVLIFLDDDSYPQDDYLEILEKDFKNEKIVAVGGPAITPIDDNFWQKVSGAVFLSSLSGGNPDRYVSIGKKRNIDDWPSVNLAVRRKDFDTVGGFGSNYWTGEDTKFCLDLINKTGKKILYDPQLIMYHHRRGSLVGHLQQIARYGLHRGFFAKKYPQTSLRLKYFLPSIFLIFGILWVLGILGILGMLGAAFYLLALTKAVIDIYCYEKNPLIILSAIYYIVLTHLVYGFTFLKGFVWERKLDEKQEDKLRFLILNWRDIKNPNGGGAEILTQEIAKRLMARGYEVTHFTSEFEGCKKEEIVDGVKVIRKGSAAIRKLFNSVHFQALWFYLTQGIGKYDVLIDEVHGIPFFTNFYAFGIKRLVLVCEVAGEVWDVMFPYPLNVMGKFAERLYLFLYHREKFLAISPSTKNDLVKVGIPAKNITVIPMGVNVYPLDPLPKKEKTLTLIFVGRIMRSKGLDQAVRALELIKKEIPEVKLWVVGGGGGEYEQEVRSLVKELKLEKNIIFQGFVSQKEKFVLMAKAHFIVVPSLKEGWGLIVPEAGRVGTPAIVYNIAGLKDIIKDRVNGRVVETNPKTLAEAVKETISSDIKYSQMRKMAQNMAKQYDWDKTTKTVIDVLN